MSKQVLFNGAVLVRPGAATKIDASQFQNVVLDGVGVVALLGSADGGQPSTLQTFRDAKGVADHYRSGNLVEAAAILADPGNDPRIPSGASAIVCYKTNASTQSTLVHDTVYTFTSLDYGLHTNSIRAAIASSGADLRILTITGLDSQGNLLTETSPEFGSTVSYGKFSIQYTGGGSAATMTITATTLTTSVTGAPGDDLTITFADYPSLAALVFYLDGLVAYDCVALITNASSFNPGDMDGLVAQDIRTAVYTAMAHNFDLIDWVNSNSSLLSAAVSPLGSTGPRTVLVETALGSAVSGVVTNTSYTNGFTALGTIRANQVVPLTSKDGTGTDTSTIGSVLAGLEAHCKLQSATLGKNERQGWGALKGTKATLIAQANVLNSEHLQLSGQEIKRRSAVTSNLVWFDEWALCTVMAGMRAGAPLGEPLTHKFIKASELRQDSSWDNNDDADVSDMILNGVMTVAAIQGEGFRIEKGITTYTKSDNDAFTEESIVQGWKNIAFQWRTYLERLYTGRPATPEVLSTVVPMSVALLTELRDAGQIADSVVDGEIQNGFKDINASLSGDQLSVSGTISPTSGINFTLNTLVLVPAQFSV